MKGFISENEKNFIRFVVIYDSPLSRNVACSLSWKLKQPFANDYINKSKPSPR